MARRDSSSSPADRHRSRQHDSMGRRQTRSPERIAALTQPSVSLHPEALEEAVAATEWYAKRSRRAAESFLDEIDRVIGAAFRKHGAVSVVRFRNAPGNASEVPLVPRVPGNFERSGNHRWGPQSAPVGVLA